MYKDYYLYTNWDVLLELSGIAFTSYSTDITWFTLSD